MKRAADAVKPRALIVAGVMSGTSADGVDVALARISAGPDGIPRIRLMGHRGFPYVPALRERVLAAMDADSISVAELARLSWRLGEVYADSIAKTCAELNVTLPETAQGRGRTQLNLVGMHGQTLYHQAVAAQYAGSPVRATWQTGEPAVVRERLGVPVVSDFRPADLAAGGQGAPLVPMLDFCQFRSASRHRVLLNLGGIANVTVIPAGASLNEVVAFDTGPANMVIDALMMKLYGRAYDRNGATAAKGTVQIRIVGRLLTEPYFFCPPPKSCGREQFGGWYAERLHTLCTTAGAGNVDVIATATELTVRSLLDAFERFCQPILLRDKKVTEVVAAGGGTRNQWLMKRLREEFKARGAKLLAADDLGFPSEAKEASAFALLAWLSWHGLPGNVPSATGARRPVILGRVSCG